MRAEHNITLERMRALIARLTEADIAYYKNPGNTGRGASYEADAVCR